MFLNSALFIFVFLPGAVGGYYLLGRFKLTTLARLWVLLASFLFYAYFSLALLALAIASALVNFSLGCLLGRAYSTPGNGTNHALAGDGQRKKILAAGLLFNIGLLASFKYTPFILQSVNSLLQADILMPEFVLPLGISYYTFQQIAYLVDCYRNRLHERDFFNYCLFLTFFPRVIAGPIVRYGEMMPQFARIRTYVADWRNLAMGVSIFFMGLCKKVVIADSFSLWANKGFDSTAPLSFFEAWGSSLSYTFQLYYDFSGYSEMAIGAALLLNIRLPINFNSPYQAKNIQDFWRRWHITLSRWLRDYLYIPLGGSRAGILRTSGNIFATFLLAGLWHGAGWTFVFWGGLHGAALVICRLWQRVGIRLNGFLGWAATFLFVNVAWVFFRAETFTAAIRVVQGMVGVNGYEVSEKVARTVNRLLHSWPQFKIAGVPATSLLLPGEALGGIVLFGLAAFLLPNTLEVFRYLENKTAAPTRIRSCLISNYRGFWAVATALVVITGLYKMLSVRATEFIYFNF